MKFAVALSGILLGAITALAVPPNPFNGPSLPAIRRSRRSNHLDTHSADIDGTVSTTGYDSKWAGAVLTGAGYRSVTGTIQVPKLRLPPGASSSELHAVSAWVGIDGERACPDAMLQVGVDMYLNNSIPAYWAWLHWSPTRTTYLTSFPIRPGDTLTLNITAPSLSAATFSITNQRTSQVDTGTFAAAEQTPPATVLCGLSAEWIVEDFWRSDGVPLVDFGRIAFTGARFVTDGGVTGGVQGAEVDGVREVEGGEVVIECGKVGGDGVGCEYRGGGRQ